MWIASGRSAFLPHHDIRERVAGLHNRSFEDEPTSEVGKRGKGRERLIVGLSGQDLVLSTASVAVAALFVGDLAGMSADRNRCDCILRGEFIDIERVEGGAVPFA